MDYRQLGIGCSDIVVANEYHTDRIYAVGAEEAGYGVIKAHNGDYFDAMVTQKEGLMLCIHTADCVPLVLLDPVEKAVGIVHSGWAGASKRIAGKTIKKMMEVYKSSPENIICAMGPYNHSCCYEVGEDVLERFRESFSDRECRMLFRKKGDKGKYLLDLGGAVSLSLCQEGVDLANIHDCGCCTYHTSIFSSWRRTGDKKSQMLTYIMLL